MRTALLLVAIMMTGTAQAAMVCARPRSDGTFSTTLKLREACKPNEVEIGIQQLPELMAVPGIDIVGPLPPEIQMMTVFSAGLSTAAKNVEGANALIHFLTTTRAVGVIKAKGMEVG